MIEIETADGEVWINKAHIVSFKKTGRSVRILLTDGGVVFASGTTASRLASLFDGPEIGL